MYLSCTLCQTLPCVKNHRPPCGFLATVRVGHERPATAAPGRVKLGHRRICVVGLLNCKIMKIFFLHLSDLHFRRDTDPILNRTKQIAAALGCVDAIADACIVSATGDVTFSGKKTEFDFADRFFSSLQTELSDRYRRGPCADWSPACGIFLQQEKHVWGGGRIF